MLDGLELVDALDGGPRVGGGSAESGRHEFPCAFIASPADPLALVLEQVLAVGSLGELHDPPPDGAKLPVGLLELGRRGAHLPVLGIGQGEAGAECKQEGSEEQQKFHGRVLDGRLGMEADGGRLSGEGRRADRAGGQ